MTKIERAIFINAAPEAVTAISEDPGRLPQWFTGVESVETTGAWPAAGSVTQMRMKSPGLPFVLTCTAVTHVPGERLIATMEGLVSGTFSWRYAPEKGGTVVSYITEFSLSKGDAGREMNRLIAERANEISIEQSLNNLKALVEGK